MSEKAGIATTTPLQRLLVVEDNDDTRQSLQELLQMSLHLQVDTASDGMEALHLLEKKSYSVMLTDLRMPKMSGMKLIEEVQARKLPVTTIVTTGHGSIQDAVHAMRMGAYDFLTKPADPQHHRPGVQPDDRGREDPGSGHGGQHRPVGPDRRQGDLPGHRRLWVGDTRVLH